MSCCSRYVYCTLLCTAHRLGAQPRCAEPAAVSELVKRDQGSSRMRCQARLSTESGWRRCASRTAHGTLDWTLTRPLVDERSALCRLLVAWESARRWRQRVITVVALLSAALLRSGDEGPHLVDGPDPLAPSEPSGGGFGGQIGAATNQRPRLCPHQCTAGSLARSGMNVALGSSAGSSSC